MPNYATKADLKNVTGAYWLDFAKNTNLGHLKSGLDTLDIDKLKNLVSGLSSLKSKEDKLDIGKLEITPVDLSKKEKVEKKLDMMNWFKKLIVLILLILVV